jgi:hypothetical protein
VSTRLISYSYSGTCLCARESRNKCPYDSLRVRIGPWGQTMQMCWPYGMGERESVYGGRDLGKRTGGKSCCDARPAPILLHTK